MRIGIIFAYMAGPSRVYAVEIGTLFLPDHAAELARELERSLAQPA